MNSQSPSTGDGERVYPPGYWAERAWILNALPSQIAVVDSRGEIVAVNSAWLSFGEMAGAKIQGESIGLNYLDACDSASGEALLDGQAAAAGLRSVINGESSIFTLKYPCHGPTGERWVRLRIAPIDAHPGYALVIHLDITEEMQAQIALRSSESRFRSAFNQQFQYMAMVAPSGQVLEVNDSVLRDLAEDQPTVIGSFIWETKWAKDLPGVRERWINILRTAAVTLKPVTAEAGYVGADGQQRSLDLNVRAVQNLEGVVEYLIVQAIDVTEKRIAHERIVERATLLRIAGKTARVGGWCVDLPGNNVRWSDEVSAIHETPLDYHPTVDEAFTFYAAEYLPAISAAFSKCVMNGEPFDLECEILTARGRRIWVRAVGERNEAMTQVYGALQDISDKKNAEAEARARERAEEASRAKSTFLAHMSHEIRTPMNGIIGMTEVMYQTSLEPGQLEMLDLINDSAISLLSIINDVLDFSKIEAGKMDIDQAPMSIAKVVEQVCAIQEQVATRTGVEVSLFTDPMIPALVMGDAIRVRQVLLNLVNNAIKFSKNERRVGQVSISAKLIQPWQDERVRVEFMVTDHGMGMNQETLDRLFTSFTQADSSTTRRFGGTGLGLSISSHLVQLLGGEITVKSSPGLGSTFTVQIPFDRALQGDVETPRDSGVFGLQCVVMSADIEIRSRLETYLEAGGARLEDGPRLASHQALSNNVAAEPWVCVIAASSIEAFTQLQTLGCGELRALHVRFVFVGGGMLSNPPDTLSNVAYISNHLLTRGKFLSAVAAAAGRDATPDMPIQIGDADLPNSRREPLERRGLGRTILVAEDNLNNQRVILRQLELLGYAAEIQSSGRQALARWRSRHYDILLTDLQMPEMDGYELARAIRDEEKEGRRIPIIALTATATAGEESRCFAIGMDAYLTKPARLTMLQEALEKWSPARPLVTKSATNEAVIGPAVVQPVDLAVLASLVGDDPIVLASFVSDFKIALRQAAEDIRRALENGDVIQASGVAHQIKSSARTVGALELGSLCEAIEIAGGSGSVDELATMIGEFDIEMTRVLEYLEVARPWT